MRNIYIVVLLSNIKSNYYTNKRENKMGSTIGDDISDWMEGQLTEEEDSKIRNITHDEVFKLLSIFLNK